MPPAAPRSSARSTSSSAAASGATADAPPPPPPPAQEVRASRLGLVFGDAALERAYRDEADARFLAGGHDLAAAFVILGIYTASTLYVVYFDHALFGGGGGLAAAAAGGTTANASIIAGGADADGMGEFLRTCRPLLGAGLALSLVNMLVVAWLSRAQAGARRRRAQLERRLASSSLAASSSSLAADQMRALVRAEAEREARAARRRGAWSSVARVLDALPSLLFKPRCISFWDPNWRRAAQSVASDSGAIWLALSTAQRPPASVWRALPWHAAAWLLCAARLAPEVCRKFEASPYHRAPSGATGGDPGPCACHVVVQGCLMAGGFLLPLWAAWALERGARRRWLAARRLASAGLLPRIPAAAHLLALLALFNAMWQVLHLVGSAVCRPLAAEGAALKG